MFWREYLLRRRGEVIVRTLDALAWQRGSAYLKAAAMQRAAKGD